MNSYFNQLRDTPEFAEEMLVADVQSALEQLLDETGCTRADLARRMGVSKARVTQIFSDQQNFTLRLVARAFHALGARLSLSSIGRRSFDESDPNLWAGDIEIKSMAGLKSQPVAQRGVKWEFSSVDGIVDALEDHRDLLASLQHAIEQYNQSAAAGPSSADDMRSRIRDWEHMGSNVVALRKEASHG